MKLHLKNFRCYEDQTFDLGEKGLTLLSAPTGTGKSSILMGVYFALFGVGTKVSSHGKTSCFAELEFGDMKITRTKRPNRLVLVNTINEYEDKAAQAIINRVFGETYETTGYISQNALNSFVLMSPIDKLGFLETFAFKDVELATLKDRSKKLIAEKHDLLVSVTTKLEMSSAVLEASEKPNMKQFPVKCKKIDQEKVSKGESVKFKNRGISARKAAADSDLLQTELQALTQYSADSAKDKSTLESLRKRDKELSQAIDNSELYNEKDLLDRKNQLVNLLASREVDELRSRLETDQDTLEHMEEEEIKSMEEEIRDIDAKIWIEYTKDDYAETLQSTKQCLEDSTKVLKLRDLIDKIDYVSPDELQQKQESFDTAVKDLDVKTDAHKNGKIYDCPCCSKSLCLKNGELYKYKGSFIQEVTDKDLSNAKMLVNKLEKDMAYINKNNTHRLELTKTLNDCIDGYDELDTVQDYENDLASLLDYKASQDEMERKRKRLSKAIDERNFSGSYKSFKKACEILSRDIEKISSGSTIITGVDEEKLRSSIVKAEAAKRALSSYEREKKSIKADINDLELKLEKLLYSYESKYDNFKDPEQLKEDIKTLKKQQLAFEQEQQKHGLNVQAIRDWMELQQEIADYSLKEKNVSSLTIEEKNTRLAYASASLLKSKIMEAESLAMVSVIDSINIHSQLYIDTFFRDDPMSVRLTSFKEGKKVSKPQINLEVDYKGVKCDISSLSGGELSRVVLAFTLALADMFNTPLLLLDECTSSLDQNMTAIVLEGIKDNFNGSMVLIVAHQVVTGVFDKVMTLGGED
jgi:DNA repair exonuclease SbcCD ATPase subunit